MSAKLNAMKKQILKFAAVFLGMFAVGYVSADMLISSAKSNQSEILSSVLVHAKMGKSLAFVNVQLESDDIPDNPNDTVEITGYVTLLKSSNQTMKYQWLLPEGVTLVEGEKDGQLESVVVEQPVPVKIKVSGYSRYEKKLITLSASTMIGETSFSNVAILSSRPEDSHDFIAKQRYDVDKVQQIELSSESPEAMESSPRSQEKIQR